LIISFPGIILKWPEWWPKVWIKLDNAPAHPIKGKLGAKIDATGGWRWDIGFVHQPANPLTVYHPWPGLLPRHSVTSMSKVPKEHCGHEAFVELPLNT
jgi:hypothetical protein